MKNDSLSLLMARLINTPISQAERDVWAAEVAAVRADRARRLADKQAAEDARIAAIRPTGVVRQPAGLEAILGTAYIRS